MTEVTYSWDADESSTGKWLLQKVLRKDGSYFITAFLFYFLLFFTISQQM
jgi:hypothetical protein